jgi:hypothetical protein
MMTLFNDLVDSMGTLQTAVWSLYLLAAVMLPIYHVRPILKYLRGNRGIGDACIRTEAIQCLWRVPALMFSVFVAPSLPLFLSISLDMLGRIGRVLAMRSSQRRWAMSQSGAAPAMASNEPDAPPGLQRNAPMRKVCFCDSESSIFPRERLLGPPSGPAARKQHCQHPDT